MSIELPVSESPIPNALDQYYSLLRQLLQPTDEQNIALNSTLVTFDIVKEAGLYTENVFRGFADRKVKLSPTNFGFGPADISDRFSELYGEALEAVVSEIDRTIDPEDLVRIEDLHSKRRRAQRDLQSEYISMVERWIQYKQAAGIPDDDPELLEKQIAFYNSMNFSEIIRSYKGEVAGYLEDIEHIRVRSYQNQEDRLLAKLYREYFLEQNKMARPNSPDLEVLKHYDELRMAQLWIYGNLGGTFDSSLEVRPSGTLKFFLTNVGERGFSIEKDHQAQYSHDTKWGASGTARQNWFMKVSGSVQYESHYKESLHKVRSITVKFKNVAEYWVRRGRWYSSAFFGFERVTNFLSDHPRYAAELAHIITSVVIGRGLQLTLNFTDESDVEYWDQLDIKAAGSFSVFGMNIPASDATYGSHTMRHTVDRNARTVTFFDNEEHCRLIAFRTEKLLSTDERIRAMEFQTWEDAIPEALDLLKDGKVKYSEFQDKYNEMSKNGLLLSMPTPQPSAHLFGTKEK